MEEQLSELQILLMELQRNLEDMSRQLVAHDADIAAMGERIKLLETRLRHFVEAAPEPGSMADEKPPHY